MKLFIASYSRAAMSCSRWLTRIPSLLARCGHAGYQRYRMPGTQRRTSYVEAIADEPERGFGGVHSTGLGSISDETIRSQVLVKVVPPQLSRQEKATPSCAIAFGVQELRANHWRITAMQAVQELMLRVSPSDKAVLLTGETERGKRSWRGRSTIKAIARRGHS